MVQIKRSDSSSYVAMLVNEIRLVRDFSVGSLMQLFRNYDKKNYIKLKTLGDF